MSQINSRLSTGHSSFVLSRETGLDPMLWRANGYCWQVLEAQPQPVWWYRSTGKTPLCWSCLFLCSSHRFTSLQTILATDSPPYSTHPLLQWQSKSPVPVSPKQPVGHFSVRNCQFTSLHSECFQDWPLRYAPCGFPCVFALTSRDQMLCHQECFKLFWTGESIGHLVPITSHACIVTVDVFRISPGLRSLLLHPWDYCSSGYFLLYRERLYLIWALLLLIDFFFYWWCNLCARRFTCISIQTNAIQYI